MDPISVIVGLVVAALILMFIDRLKLGLTVGGFLNAVVAAAAIAVVSWAVDWLLARGGITVVAADPLTSAILYLVLSAAVLWIAARVIPGFRTAGFTGAFVAAVAITVIVWLISELFVGLSLPFYHG